MFGAALLLLIIKSISDNNLLYIPCHHPLIKHLYLSPTVFHHPLSIASEMLQLYLLLFEVVFLVETCFIVFICCPVPILATYWRHEACYKPQNCGSGPNISFPFGIINGTTDYCGFPGYEVICNGNKPIFRTSGGDYIIQEISYASKSFTLVNTEYFTNNATCLAPLHSFTFDHSSFRYAFNRVVPLYFFYNCSKQVGFGDSDRKRQFSVSCPGNATNESFAMLNPTPQDLDFIGNMCTSSISVFIDWNEGLWNDAVKSKNYTKFLTNGFTIQWQGFSSCVRCRSSGGICGLLDQNIMCFCPDGVHSSRCNDGNTRDKMTIIAIAGSVAGISVVVILTYYFMKKFGIHKALFFWKKNIENRDVEAFLRNYRYVLPKRYSYSNIKRMTNSFREKLGEGGYGNVYKGNLQDGRVVAIKILNKSKSNGEEFINELASISRTSHINIVSLLGFCFEDAKRALIYEFMSNGSLEKFIYGKNLVATYQKLGWETMYQISLGIARGLEYLHRGCNTRILHFDIKPHNILLDGDFCPKISDFGLAKLCSRKESIISMFGARGTAGYIAPEVFCRSFGGVSHKSDVYSYGMMVLEMVGGRKNIDVVVDHTSEIYFPHWIYRRLKLDEELGLHGVMNDEEKEIVRKLLIVSLWCIQTDPSNRPPMSRVMDMLEGSVESLQIPPKPFLSSPPRSPPVDSSITHVQ